MVWACRKETVNISVEGWRGWKWQPSWSKTTEEIYWGSERGCGVSWCKRRGCRGWGGIEADGWLWPPLKGTSWRNRRRILKCHNNDLSCKWEHLPQYLGCIFLKGQAAIFRCSQARGKEKLEPHLVVLLSPLPLRPLSSLVCISTNTQCGPRKMWENYASSVWMSSEGAGHANVHKWYTEYNPKYSFNS